MYHEAFSTLKYGIQEEKGFLVLTGDVGTGKTLLIKNLEKKIPIPAIIVTVPDPNMETLEFFNFLAEEIGIKRKFKTKADFLIHFKAFLLQASDSEKKVLLIIDEAQRLNHRLLEQIRLMSNLETMKRKLINIFFIGQNEFSEMLQDEKCTAIMQRIAVNYHLEPLTEVETSLYIKHRIKLAGATKELFSPDAIRKIYNFSLGFPRQINIICDNALMYGWHKKLHVIDADVIKECVKELPIFKVSKKEQPGKEKETEAIEVGLKRKKEKVIEKQNNRKHEEKKSKIPIARRRATKIKSYYHPANPIAVTMTILVLLFGFTTYLLYDLYTKNSLRWSIEDLAPQKQFLTADSNKHKVAQKESKRRELQEKKQITKYNLEDTEKSGPAEAEESSKKKVNTSSTKREGEIYKKVKVITKPVYIEKITSKEIKKVSSEIKTHKKYYSSSLSNHISLLEDKIIIYFTRNSLNLSEQSMKTLDQIVELISTHPNLKITVAGHTDSSGNYWYNKKLSLSRANAVKNYLIEHGIDQALIKVEGMGSVYPLESNETLEGRIKNRRVEIKFNY
jgi:general secretion pathway protein A